MHPTYLYLLLFSFQTLYKTQIRELKEECDEKNKLYKDAEQQIDEYQKDRCEFIYWITRIETLHQETVRVHLGLNWNWIFLIRFKRKHNTTVKELNKMKWQKHASLNWN